MASTDFETLLRQRLADNPDLAMANADNGELPSGVFAAGKWSVDEARQSAATPQIDALVNLLAWIGAPEPVREHRFHPTRKWRLDLSWPEHLIAVEVDGGVWTQGRHTRGQGYINDCEKFLEAAIEGWTVVRVPTDWVDDGTAVALIERLLKARGVML